MFVKLATPLKRVLSEATRNKDDNGYFSSAQCLSDTGEPIMRHYFDELARFGYIQKVSDWNFITGATYHLESPAYTHDEDEAEYERQIPQPTSITNNNLYAPTDKVYFHSTDNSVNITNPADIDRLFDQIMHALRSSAIDNTEAVETAVVEMQQAVGKPSFKEKYNAFIQSAANHMTLFAPFIPLLSQLL